MSGVFLRGHSHADDSSISYERRGRACRRFSIRRVKGYSRGDEAGEEPRYLHCFHNGNRALSPNKAERYHALTDTEETKHSSLALSSHLSRLVVIDALCYYLVYRNEDNRAAKIDDENEKSLVTKRVKE